MIVHPSLMLIASLDEREYNADSAADVKRAFIHLAPTTVRKHDKTDPACNVLQLKVNFSKKYWLSADEGADEIWPQVREWLAGKRYFVGENIKSFNTSRGERAEQTVDYRQIDLLMAKNAVHVAVEPGCELPVFEDFAQRLRELVNAGVLGQGGAPVEVNVPSLKSLEAQRAAWQESCEKLAAEQAAAAQAQQEGEAAPEQAAQADAAQAGEAMPEQDAPEAPAAAGAPEDAPEPEPAAVPPMTVDYSVWGVVVDGQEREFDPAKGEWL